jgi:membrane dipeptidase
MSKNNAPGLSRRKFIATAVGAGGAALLRPAWLNAAGHAVAGQAADDIDPRLAQVKATTIAIDMHNHVFSAMPRPGDGTTPGLTEQLKRAGLTAIVAGYKIPFDPNAKPGETNVKLLNYLTVMDALLEKEHMRRAMNLKDLEAAHRNGQPTIVQAIEGAQFLEGHLERVGVAYQRGLRHLQLLHDDDDPVAPLGDLDSKPAHLGGLTRFGAEVIKECNRLGILVDMAHASPDTIKAVTKLSTRPFIVSHTGFDGPISGTDRMMEMMKPRLLNKERAKVVADAGGVIGIWIYMANSLQEYVENVKRMVDAVGIDHVGIGTDTDLISSQARGTNFAWPGLNGGFFDAVAAEMLHRGFTPGDIEKFGGGNYCRVFGDATAGHA